MHTLSDELLWRNLIKDRTFEDVKWLDEPKTFYLGVDCASSSSMTIGNLAVFMVARRLLDQGWKTVLLVGGATSLIGDPGGKEEERDLKSRKQITENVAGIKAQVERLFAGKDFTLVDNYDWLKDVRYLDFLRDVGKHFSMTELVQRDYIANRIGEGGTGISYAEFSYSLLQGYDYWHLHNNHNVVLQIGGSDQWGNMLSGVPLIRKKENTEVHALSVPLVINKATGKKFGKSEDGAVWLDPAMTSVYKFYQFWLNVDDDSAIEHLKVYTLLTRQEIETIQAEFNRNKGARLAQKRLAYEVTSIVHGADKAQAARAATELLFGNTAAQDVDDGMFQLLSQELPVVVNDGTALPQLLVAAGLATSSSEALRMIKGGAVSINGAKVMAPFDAKIDATKPYSLIRYGKNNFMIVTS